MAARSLAVDPRMAAYIVRAVARAVDAVHRTKGADGEPLGLVHGDLQPKQVLISRDGVVKLKGFAAPSLAHDPVARAALYTVILWTRAELRDDVVDMDNRPACALWMFLIVTIGNR